MDPGGHGALRRRHPVAGLGPQLSRREHVDVPTGDLSIAEYTIVYLGRPSYTVSIMEFKNGKVVHETQYFADPFDPPAWRAQWAELRGH
jgi:hypothetical protein